MSTLALCVSVVEVVLPVSLANSTGFVIFELGGYDPEVIKFSFPLVDTAGVLNVIQHGYDHDLAIALDEEVDDKQSSLATNEQFDLFYFLKKGEFIRASVMILNQLSGESNCVAKGFVIVEDLKLDLDRNRKLVSCGFENTIVEKLQECNVAIPMVCVSDVGDVKQKGKLILSLEALLIKAKFDELVSTPAAVCNDNVDISAATAENTREVSQIESPEAKKTKAFLTTRSPVGVDEESGDLSSFDVDIDHLEGVLKKAQETRLTRFAAIVDSDEALMIAAAAATATVTGTISQTGTPSGIPRRRRKAALNKNRSSHIIFPAVSTTAETRVRLARPSYIQAVPVEEIEAVIATLPPAPPSPERVQSSRTSVPLCKVLPSLPKKPTAFGYRKRSDL
jgi:hypothetical protein